MKPLLLAVCALAVTAAVAHAGTFRGQTSQGRPAVLKTNDERFPVHVRISWRADCTRGRFRHSTTFRPPYDLRTRREVRDSGSYSFRDGEFRVRVRSRMRARRVAPRRWRGTFGATAFVRREGRLIARCPSGTIRWRVSR